MRKTIIDILTSSPIYRNNRKEAVIEYIWRTYEWDANDILWFEKVIRWSTCIDGLVREIARIQNSKNKDWLYIYAFCQPDLFIKAKRIFAEKKAREHYGILARIKNYFIN